MFSIILFYFFFWWTDKTVVYLRTNKNKATKKKKKLPISIIKSRETNLEKFKKKIVFTSFKKYLLDNCLNLCKTF